MTCDETLTFHSRFEWTEADSVEFLVFLTNTDRTFDARISDEPLFYFPLSTRSVFIIDNSTHNKFLLKTELFQVNSILSNFASIVPPKIIFHYSKANKLCSKECFIKNKIGI